MAMKLKELIVLLMAILLSQGVVAQDKFIAVHKLAILGGVRDTKIDSFPNAQNVDFMNYIYGSLNSFDYGYIGFEGQFRIKSKWAADIKVAMYDDFAPDNLDISVQYFPVRSIGISLGLYTHSQLMNDFTMFHRTTGTGLYGDLETNFRQRKLFDRGMQVGVLFARDFGAFHPSLKINGGISSFKPFAETVLQKEINGNFLSRIDYETKNTWNPFIFPELRFDIDCLNINNYKIGVQFQASLFYSQKAINYEQTTYMWTLENPLTEKVDSPTHSYRKFDMDMGIYMRW